MADDVWKSCRTWRADYLNKHTSTDTAMGSWASRSNEDNTNMILEFKRGRVLGPGSTTKIGYGGNYFNILRKMQVEPSSSGDIDAKVQANIKLDNVDYALTTIIRYKKGMERDGGTLSGKIFHTDPAHLPKLLEHIGKRYKDAMEQGEQGERVEPATFIKALGELHWLLAQAMPDYRGSAAKAELTVRSMAQAKGIHLPPFKREIEADLEAFVTPIEEFKTNYHDFFESTDTMKGIAEAAADDWSDLFDPIPDSPQSAARPDTALAERRGVGEVEQQFSKQ